MKRFTALMILTIYMVFSTGLTVYSHYCAGKLASLSILASKKKDCEKCGQKKMSKGCCKNTQHNYSLDDAQLGSKSSFNFYDYSGLVALLPSFNYTVQPEFALANSNSTKFYSYKNGPPKTPIFIQNHSLII